MTWDGASFVVDTSDASLDSTSFNTEITCTAQGLDSTSITPVQIAYTVDFSNLPVIPLLKADMNLLGYTIDYSVGSIPITVTPLCVYDPIIAGYTIDY